MIYRLTYVQCYLYIPIFVLSDLCTFWPSYSLTFIQFDLYTDSAFTVWPLCRLTFVIWPLEVVSLCCQWCWLSGLEQSDIDRLSIWERDVVHGMFGCWISLSLCTHWADFLFQPVFHSWYAIVCIILSGGWCIYKILLIKKNKFLKKWRLQVLVLNSITNAT